MASWGNEIEHCVDSVIHEPRITLDSRLFREVIVVLLLKIPYNLREATSTWSMLLGLSCAVGNSHLPCLIVDVFSETGRVDNSQRNAGPVLFKFDLWEAVKVKWQSTNKCSMHCLPTVTGLIFSPGSTRASAASSDSL